ncbi:endogenous retrovirus group 3 member 1 Env polyprotein-like [Hemitrygon akajei]|uniref:endogenous retrovirus group 3 member 1 Env polyprotein-like n=1 Tax=Hemitrygon akajei TaxID=2704970 RepID=UPI003BFA28E0
MMLLYGLLTLLLLGSSTSSRIWFCDDGTDQLHLSVGDSCMCHASGWRVDRLTCNWYRVIVKDGGEVINHHIPDGVPGFALSCPHGRNQSAVCKLAGGCAPLYGKRMGIYLSRRRRDSPPLLPSVFRNNMFLRMSHEYARRLNLTKCWVCSTGPLDSDAGVPMIQLPFRREEYWAWVRFNNNTGEVDPPSDNVTNLPMYQHLFTGWYIPAYDKGSAPPTFPVAAGIVGRDCVCRRTRRGIRVGNSYCNGTTTHTTGRVRGGKGALNGTYWICGDTAYPWLPYLWNGCCYLAYAVPYLHHVTRLRDHQSARVRRGLSAAELFFGAIIPGYGVVKVSREVDKLYDLVESIANETAKGLVETTGAVDALTSEVVAIRTVALQNRIALDFLLAKEGGTCAVIGAECCTYIPDVTENVTNLVHHVREAVANLHKVSADIERDKQPHEGGPFSWFADLFGDWGHTIVQWFVFVILFIIFVALCVFVIKQVIQRCVTPRRR